ncbi:6-pyruvoyl trahydropterin synthase family protein [Nonomuraea basaltis]|uniref:6-pyruvoyl trahydropterin synthase family protein n=1 Tax=Nonomuraea basaltis TaxID=2495887 RepID=UPI00110C6FF2|nr:6-carboxytetrahydropterin synthase [Nonomuraea basaltis]TMR92547.1 6-carboxytetrahydropterin synthase [Nonomuraea basaltis]
MFAAQLTHIFDAAHRLPILPSKDASLHGHTWRVTISIAAATLNNGVLVEFGSFKGLMRDWIDTHLDHAALLGTADPLLPALRAEGCRVFVFDADAGHASSWPTVETVTALIAHHADQSVAVQPAHPAPGRAHHPRGRLGDAYQHRHVAQPHPRHLDARMTDRRPHITPTRSTT